jgi:coproporphyrinogen III oxidase-like Fe-S oxidoreductase
MAQKMIKRGLKGTRFSRIEPDFSSDLNGIGWYVHMPFCRRICPYCCFYSIQHSPDKVAPYVEAVKKEIKTYRDRLGDITIGDVYFGGGTPSLTWKAVIEIIDYIRSTFNMAGEVGCEANPEDINETMCDALKQAGVTKMSFGVQSFNDEVLRTMRRRYDYAAVMKAIELLLSKGFYVSIDLLYGLPQQTMSSLLNDLEKAAGSGAHQISFYPLMLFSYTRWFHDIQNGSIKAVAPRLEKKMFYTISDFLTTKGYKQASCWDFSNGGTQSQYVTCTRDENIGVGLSAYTKLGGDFYVNTFSLKEYIKGVDRGLPIATGMTMPSKRVIRRWFMMGLFRLKVGKDEFQQRFGMSMEEGLGGFLSMLKMLNIIKEHSDYIEVTWRGMYWASLMTKTSMLSFPGRYYEECLRSPWPDEFEM